MIVVLKDLLMQGYRFKLPQIESIVVILRELSASGRNKETLKNYKYMLRKLPKNPNGIPYGHWHEVSCFLR